ncbi:MAG: ATP-binding protein [Bacteroidetes bacterium]|nr:ATP-binding protein [Bacteroidota bacterium]MBL7104312.1 ATP-binding protein [Bacteroidales bacterium]
MKPSYIHKLIVQGEHQQLDFKFEIADSQKIARTFSAFANTDGGKLLIGVKDNGTIAGVRSVEEYYMAEAAANMYSKPEIKFKSKEWVVEGKKVLEITIPASNEKPHYAQNEDGKWLAYIRVHDQNILANRVLVNTWKRKKSKEGTYINYTEKEKLLLEYLENHDSITLSKFRRIAGISAYKAGNILTNFLTLNIIETEISEKWTVYRLSGEFKEEEM